ncbi:MAG: SsrA-binding protein SmpB [Candidatus Delongbacteria bacterium]|nr:SsrA-binding protein SmpB [Candidatus Delongbacteria bacterium]
MKKPKTNPDLRVIARNKRASHDYHILDRFEAGLVLQGTEVKSIRMGRVNLKDAYARIKDGEIWLTGMHVTPYEHGNIWNHTSLRERKLLLHRREIRRLRIKVEQRGLTLVPLDIYFRRHLVKVTLALVQGKREYDKRATIQQQEQKREIARMLKEKQRRY